jgi:hypothetical protein
MWLQSVVWFQGFLSKLTSQCASLSCPPSNEQLFYQRAMDFLLDVKGHVFINLGADQCIALCTYSVCAAFLYNLTMDTKASLSSNKSKKRSLSLSLSQEYTFPSLYSLILPASSRPDFMWHSFCLNSKLLTKENTGSERGSSHMA